MIIIYRIIQFCVLYNYVFAGDTTTVHTTTASTTTHDENDEFHRHIKEDGLKQPIFGSYNYDPVRQIFDVTTNNDHTADKSTAAPSESTHVSPSVSEHEPTEHNATLSPTVDGTQTDGLRGKINKKYKLGGTVEPQQKDNKIEGKLKPFEVGDWWPKGKTPFRSRDIDKGKKPHVTKKKKSDKNRIYFY